MTPNLSTLSPAPRSAGGLRGTTAGSDPAIQASHPESGPALLTGLLIVECAWCRTTVGTKPCIAELDGKTSHTICRSCLEAVPVHLALQSVNVDLWKADALLAQSEGMPAGSAARLMGAALDAMASAATALERSMKALEAKLYKS